MSKFDQSQTKQNLARAFAGECQDGARYQFLAKQAQDEGYFYIQTIFKTHAKNEMAHAKKFYNLLTDNCSEKQYNIDICGGYPFTKGGLLESMKDTMNTESSQSANVYPDFAQVACDEGFHDMEKAFLFAASVENCHKLMLEQLITKMEKGTLYKSPEPIKWKCSNCGFEHTDKKAWDMCPSCDLPQGYVEIPIDMNSGD
jgi:rubrerythrin